MTTETQPVETEYEELLSSLEEVARLQRDPNVPTGTVLGVGDIEGAPATWKKQASMVSYAGKALPERLPYWNQLDGQLCMLPTANLPQLLAERVDGKPVFTRTKPEGFERTPIAETCEVCLKRRKGIPRPFYDESDLDAHYSNLHPRELATKRRIEDRAERTAEAARQERLADAILAAVNRGQPVDEAVASVVTFTCDFAGCPRFFDTNEGLARHKAAHKE